MILRMLNKYEIFSHKTKLVGLLLTLNYQLPLYSTCHTGNTQTSYKQLLAQLLQFFQSQASILGGWGVATPRFLDGRRGRVAEGSQNIITFISYNVQESEMKTRFTVVTCKEKQKNLCIIKKCTVNGKLAWINANLCVND